MAKTGVNQAEWGQSTGKVASAVNEISTIPTMTFKRTDLRPFTQFNELISKSNSSIKNLKDYTEKDTKNMNKAAKNKIDDDHHEASQTRSKLQ